MQRVMGRDAKPSTSHGLFTGAQEAAAFETRIEALLEKKRDALIKDSSDIGALIQYLFFLVLYLEIRLPDKHELFAEPLSFIVSVLDQQNKGSPHPILSKKVHSRPVDNLGKQLFKVNCVVAGDVFYEASKNADIERRSLSRAEADDIICSQSQIQEVGKKLRLSPTPSTMKGWRRQLRDAQGGSASRAYEEKTRSLFKKLVGSLPPKKAVSFLLSFITWQRII